MKPTHRKCLSSIMFVTLLFVAKGSVGQEAKLPDSRAGKVLASWLEYMNADASPPSNAFNPAAFRDKTKQAAKSRTEFRNRGRELFGSLKLVKVVAEQDREITVVLAGRENQQLLVTIYLVPKPDDLIDSVKIEPYRGGEPTHSNTSMSDEVVSERISDVLTRAAKAGFSGAVLLARDSEPIFTRAYGLANRSYLVENDVDTKFNLGSMNKMFTATAIMQLVENKKLDLNDPISKYLDESWLPKSITSEIQIKHLLSHTSGLGSYFNQEFQKTARGRLRDIDDYKTLISSESLAFTPGSDWQYSNTGFLLLGAIVEKVSSGSYFDYVQKNIYAPAGMLATGCFDLDCPTENLAYGYWQDDGQWKNNLFLHVIKGGPAGGGYSTVQDLLRFSNALIGGKLLSRESTRKMVTPKPESPRYGYGFEVQQTPSGLAVGHSGGFPGIEANLTIFLDKRVTLVVLCNAEGSMSLVLDDIRGLVASMED